MNTVKRLTPNGIANLVMGEDAWHDSEYVRAEDYDALLAQLVRLREKALKAEPAESAEAELSHEQTIAMREALELIESVYESAGELAMALHEARNMFRAVREQGTVVKESLTTEPDEHEVLHVYTGTEGARYWWSGGAWLYPGDSVVVRRAAARGKG